MIRFQFRETLIASMVVVGGLILLLIYTGRSPRSDGAAAESLLLYCAAGVQPPVSEAIREYESANPVTVQMIPGGSGTLLSEIRVAGGDLFVAADRQYLQTARESNLVGEIFPIATQMPVIVVPKGNPRRIRGPSDLLQNGVRLSLGDPKMAAIGKVVEGLMKKDDLWKRLWQKSVIHRETVNQVANDVKLTAADAGIVWDATAMQYPTLEIVRVDSFEHSKNEIAVGLITASKHPEAARRFAEYLTAPDKGLAIFKKYGYAVVAGPAPR
jgi:molybdate transport system substrate-binding protein